MDKFSKFFPAPEFLKMPPVGIDISDQSVRYLELTPKGDAYVLGKFGEKKIPSGVIKSGKIEDIDGLKKILRLIREENGFLFANVSLPEEQAYLFRMAMPKVKRKELRDSIELQLEEHVPLKADEATLDYHVLGESKQEYDLEVAALPKTVATSYFNLISGVGFEPVFFEIESQSIARAVLPRGDQGTHMIVDFGENRTGVSIAHKGIVMYTSTIDVGGENLNESIQKSFNVDEKEAEKIKKEYGLTRHDEKTKELFHALMHPISILKDELNKHFVYWHTHNEKGEVERSKIEGIVLTGGDSNLLGFADYLSASLKVPVSVGNVWQNVSSFDDYIPEISMNNSLRYATSIGLVLAGIYDYD